MLSVGQQPTTTLYTSLRLVQEGVPFCPVWAESKRIEICQRADEIARKAGVTNESTLANVVDSVKYLTDVDLLDEEDRLPILYEWKKKIENPTTWFEIDKECKRWGGRGLTDWRRKGCCLFDWYSVVILFYIRGPPSPSWVMGSGLVPENARSEVVGDSPCVVQNSFGRALSGRRSIYHSAALSLSDFWLSDHTQNYVSTYRIFAPAR